MKILSCIVFILFQINCRKDVSNFSSVASHKDNASLTEYWRNEESVYSMSPMFNSDSNILVSHTDGSDNIIFKLLQRNTGKVLWIWNDYIKPEGLFLESSRLVSGNLMYLAIGNRTYCIDILNGNTVWKIQMPDMIGESSFAHSSAGSVYRAFYSVISGEMSVYLVSTTLKGFVKVFSIPLPAPNASDMFIGNLNVHSGLKGDLLSFTLIVRNNSGSPEMWLGAYDVFNKKLKYLKNESKTVSTFSRVRGVIEDSVMITLGSNTNGNWSVFAYNAMDGHMIWSKAISDFGVGVKFYHSKLIVLCNGKADVLCLEKNNGNVVWTSSSTSIVNQFSGFNFFNSVIVEPYLFTSQCEYLTVFNLESGKRILEEKIISQGSCCMSNALALDKNERRFFASDRRYVHCFSLPPEIKF